MIAGAIVLSLFAGLLAAAFLSRRATRHPLHRRDGYRGSKDHVSSSTDLIYTPLFFDSSATGTSSAHHTASGHDSGGQASHDCSCDTSCGSDSGSSCGSGGDCGCSGGD